MGLGNTYGRNVLETVGASVQVAADDKPIMKVGGITLDWSVVAAVTQDTYLEDGMFIPAGEQYLRYGQVLTRELPTNTQIITITGATGGTWTLTVVNPLTNVTMTTAPIPFYGPGNSVQTALGTGTDVQMALAALGNIGLGNVLVVGPAGGPYQVTFTGALLGNTVATMTANSASLTGSAPAVSVSTTVPNNASYGLWGPYDPNDVSGRQLLTMDNTFILNETVRQIDFHSMNPPALMGGKVWKDRIIMTTGTASLLAGPTVTALTAVMPLLQFVKN